MSLEEMRGLIETRAEGELPAGVELEDRPCPVGCRAPDRTVLEGQDRLHGIPGRFRIVECSACGLMRTNPRPTPATIVTYYPEDYGPYASTRVGEAKPLAASGWRRRLRELLGLTPRQLPKIAPGSLVEIGCASGAFLAEMKQRGWKVAGVEFSDAAAAQARASGFEVQTSTVETAKPPADRVDLVAAWMVLEHLHDPVAALCSIRRWVKPDGWLVASIPDIDSKVNRAFGELAYDLHLPNHLFHYNAKSIGAVLRKAGWRLERTWWQRNPNTFLASLERYAVEGDRRALAGFARWASHSPGAGKLRIVLGWFLGVTAQSGRLEIWARPDEAAVARQP